MLRRLVAGLAAIVLVVEAAVLVLVHIVLGRTTANQSMSIAGSDPDVMSKATYATGAGMGAFLVLCAVLAATTALRDRSPGRFGRVVLISGAVAHGVLGILSVVLVGWAAFATMMLILCLLVLTLTSYAARNGGNGGGEGDPGGDAPPLPPPPPFGELKPTSP
ncbi:hypothetical protein Snoj_78690 [Streptomyces nojiriensis]|uniref:Integral membrane protein n=1 Tax=Streptomyces nojiriensis TaxID=66374 RepID=A0ABQ3T0Q3_9ACTN|nr:hypothetical protein [Streptomyces nojiriensis]QTI47455.1 hypothetical protein JYK04_05304 [Streptomyces nojiriensis]GGR78038.1 hypothetical protein GCM10010205_03620 [Streptomyces nojiriensis]GHI73951.1 hypothetical protein Snoj_78690 [Streptomyces nojiriensis]